MNKKVLGMGTATMDVVLRCRNLPKADQFEMIEHEQVTSGGSCANMLVTLSQLGVETMQMAKIGDDELGKTFRRDLKAAGVNDDFLLEVSGGTTMHTYIIAAAGGQHTIFSSMGDCIMNLRPEEVKPEQLEGVGLFYADLFPAKPALAMARLCREQKIPVIFCLQCPLELMNNIGVETAEIWEMLSLADLFIAGRSALCSLTGAEDYRQAVNQILRDYEPRLGVVCTAGEQGALWAEKGETTEVGAYSIEPVDTTGAGDCFLGGLIYYYFYQEKTKRQSLEFASAAAAMKCMQHGPRIKTDVMAIEAFINTNDIL